MDQDKKAEIVQLLKDAAPKSTHNSARECTDCGARLKILKYYFIASLIGTMLPHPYLNAFCAISAAVSGLILTIFTFRHPGRTSRRFAAGILVLAAASIFSGCSPMLARENTEVLQICKERGCDRYAIARGVRILGLPVKRVSVQDAKLQAGINDLFATEIISGYGLVSVDLVRVYGG